MQTVAREQSFASHFGNCFTVKSTSFPCRNHAGKLSGTFVVKPEGTPKPFTMLQQTAVALTSVQSGHAEGGRPPADEALLPSEARTEWPVGPAGCDVP